jgi:ABC-type amino acid transport substrate-binding protein
MVKALPRRLLFFILPILLTGLVAAQCRPPAPANPTPGPAPTPTTTPFIDFPPIQPGNGSDLLDRLLETGVIRVGIRVWPEAGYAPPAFRGFSNATTGGALNGFEVELAHQLAQAMRLELELVEAYPPVLDSGDWRGQWDIAIASLTLFDQPPPGGLVPLQFSTPYAYMPAALLIPAESPHIQTPADLAGKQIGVLEHSSYQRLLAAAGQPVTAQGMVLNVNLPAIQIKPVSNLPKAIRELGQPQPNSPDRIDAIFGPAPVFNAAIQDNVPVKLLAPVKEFGRQPLAIAAVPQDGLAVDRLIHQINLILEQFRRQGTLAEITGRWYGQDLSRPPAESSSATTP